VEVPKTRYVTTPDGVSLAYQVVGDGSTDLVFIPGWISNLDLFWELDAPRRFFERLASFARLIIFDKRGTGLSDPIDEAATLETRMDDLRAVMDAAGSERAAICGYSEGGSVAALFAATFPERTSHLLVLHAPIDPSRSVLLSTPAWREVIAREWGQGALMEYFVPNHVGDPRAEDNWAQSQRRSASRGMALKYFDLMYDMDATSVLPNIHVPTLVMTRVDDPVVAVESVRDYAGTIPGARLVELPGNDHLVWLGDWERMTDEIEEFVTGAVLHHEPDRVLATVLFTDIVSSTEQAGALGDGAWRDLLAEHDAIASREIGRHQGRLLKSTGDGVLATFDGPARAIRSACAIRDRVGRLGIEIRAGLHTGECELIGDDIGGVAVHIAARVSSEARASEVLVSRTVKDLVAGSGVVLSDRGEHTLKGIDEPWHLYAVDA
jgi:pimeloyl-ACP methyl ester carboxylesterase